MLRLYFLAVAFVALGCNDAERALPPLPTASEIHAILSYREKTPVRVVDPEVVERVVALANQYREGWTVPLAGPPVAQTQLEFYSDGLLVATLGLGDTFLTRTHDNFYSRVIGESRVQEFRDLLGITSPYD